MRYGLIWGGVVVAYVVTLTALYFYANSWFRSAQLEQAWSTATLYVQSLRAEIDRRRYLPEILATDDDLIAFAVEAEPS